MKINCKSNTLDTKKNPNSTHNSFTFKIFFAKRTYFFYYLCKVTPKQVLHS